jgi:hypothetical protein
VSTPRLERSSKEILDNWTASTSARDFCRKLGFTFNLDAAKRMIAGEGLAYPAPHWNQQSVVPPEETVEETHAHNLEVQRLKDKLAATEKLYKAACKHENLYADVLEVAREVMAKTPPAEVQPPHIGKGETSEDAILTWADWHGGEVVDYDIMRGWNAYNPTIMCRRAQSTVDTTLKLLFDCHQGTTFGHLYVFDMGDSVTGDLLDEAKATNALGVFESLRVVAEIRARALTELAAHIPVSYVAVPGNHPRRGAKMQWKLPTENGDWLIAEMIADKTAGNPRISVVVPKAWTVAVNVRGFNHALNHGYSAAKGGYGGISFYAFQRADGKLTALESAHGQRIHYRWLGHVHQMAELPKMDGAGKQFVVGSLMGGNEYALEGLNAYSEPSQKLVGCHETYGVTWAYDLQVRHTDDTPSRYEDVLP